MPSSSPPSPPGRSPRPADPRSRRSARSGALDTLLVAGGPGAAAAERDSALLAAVAAAARHARRVTSVCSGALVLAAAGLLEGRRATCHWASGPELAERYPGVAVETDPIYIRDGDVWTAADGSAGIDLALALVEEDPGRDVALAVARWLVVYLHRPGGQAQFSAQLRRNPRSAGRCASCRPGSPSISTRTCRSTRSRAACT